MIARYLLVSLLTGLTVSDKFTLPDDYSVEVLPPTEDDSPVELLASVNLRNILDVMETKQQIREGRGRLSGTPLLLLYVSLAVWR